MSEKAMYEVAESFVKSPRFFNQSLSDRAWNDLNNYHEMLDEMGRITPLVEEAFSKAEGFLSKNDAIFYVAGPLTEASAEDKYRYDLVNREAARIGDNNTKIATYVPHLHGTDPVANPDVDPDEVHDIDYLFARVVPDGHINFWYPVAHGNAMEEAWADEARIPSLYVLPEKRLSRIVRGTWNILGSVVYTDFETDGLPRISEFFRGVHAHMDSIFEARLEDRQGNRYYDLANDLSLRGTPSGDISFGE